MDSEINKVTIGRTALLASTFNSLRHKTEGVPERAATQHHQVIYTRLNSDLDRYKIDVASAGLATVATATCESPVAHKP